MVKTSEILVIKSEKSELKKAEKFLIQFLKKHDISEENFKSIFNFPHELKLRYESDLMGLNEKEIFKINQNEKNYKLIVDNCISWLFRN